jgi:hypothetical protein
VLGKSLVVYATKPADDRRPALAGAQAGAEGAA